MLPAITGLCTPDGDHEDDDPDDGGADIDRWGLAAFLASLPRKHGGCGYRSAVRLAPAAYFASLTRVARHHQARRSHHAALFARTMQYAQDAGALAQSVVPVVNVQQPFCSRGAFPDPDPSATPSAQLLADLDLTELELLQLRTAAWIRHHLDQAHVCVQATRSRTHDALDALVAKWREKATPGIPTPPPGPPPPPPLPAADCNLTQLTQRQASAAIHVVDRSRVDAILERAGEWVLRVRFAENRGLLASGFLEYLAPMTTMRGEYFRSAYADYLLLPSPEARQGVWQCPTCTNVRFSDDDDPEPTDAAAGRVPSAYERFLYHVDTACGAVNRRHHAIGNTISTGFNRAGITFIADSDRGTGPGDGGKGRGTIQRTACLYFQDAKGGDRRLDAMLPDRGLNRGIGQRPSIGIDYKGIEVTCQSQRELWGDLAPPGKGHTDPDVYLAVCVAQRQRARRIRLRLQPVPHKGAVFGPRSLPVVERLVMTS
uniref:Uncharacterized protein n=1 Tax=Phaeomonas parva TaxID=124430 RepID=A0A6U4HGM9_9STRA|mmetsp:Transcript_35951/g.112877  ORF Transcript_35951/g.112877 Transcript_35951/m.112877 type:complete len:487 (+) Transcript_35951:2120-3580(+)